MLLSDHGSLTRGPILSDREKGTYGIFLDAIHGVHRHLRQNSLNRMTNNRISVRYSLVLFHKLFFLLGSAKWQWKEIALTPSSEIIYA